MEKNTAQTTEDLIASLSNELTEVDVLPHPLKRAIPWAIFGVLYITLVLTILGVREDFDTKISDPGFVYELLHILALSISSGFASLWLRIPDIMQQKWVVSVPLTLFFSYAAWAALYYSMSSYSDVHAHFHWHFCHLHAVIFGLIPAASIWYLGKMGKTTHPILITIMNVLAVGGLGYLGLRVTCISDDLAHLFVTHTLPYLVLGAAACASAKWIYRW